MSVIAPSVANPLLRAEDPTTDRLPVKTLSQQDFLKILVTQITSQNPLQPSADLSSIAQMAQFTALEQARQMQSDLQQLRSQQAWLQAAALLGRPVAVQADANTRLEGVVEAVQLDTSGPRLVVDGQLYSLDQVVAVLSSANA
jgi:flagellar basal-body rod modification protein FlgD